MKKMDRVLNKLSDLYDFNRKLKAFKLKEEADRSLAKDATEDCRAIQPAKDEKVMQ